MPDHLAGVSLAVSLSGLMALFLATDNQHLGYTDSVAARTLTANGASAGGGSVLTVALCTQACQAGGYILAGVEYSGECYCGNSISNGGGPAPDGLTGCNMVCNGNSSEYCGGPNRLDVYGYGKQSTIAPPWSSLGCYTDVSEMCER
jgi:hypothetical protein